METIIAHRTFLLCALFVVLAATLMPFINPFGNNPDIIGDESYFLTSALTSMEHLNPLPGLDFSVAGNYYGGPQTYVDTALIVPVIGVIMAGHHFSLSATELWIALNTGYLLDVLRVANTAIVLLCCGFLFAYFNKREIPRDLALSLLLLLFLLLGNSLVIGFVHTAKVWTLYLLCDVVAGTFFIANEYYLSERGEPFLPKERYVAVLIWTSFIAFFQNYVGVFPVLLWIAYAFILRHISPRDVWKYTLRHWYYLAGFSILQLSFLYRAAFVRYHPTWWDPGDVSVRTATQAVDWLPRLLNPILFAFESQPLLILYIIGIIALTVLYARHTLPFPRRNLLFLLIAVIHPLAVYVAFHVLLGFSLFPRYALPFTVALSFSIVMLLSRCRILRTVALFLSGVLMTIVLIHSLFLYNRPASDVLIADTITSRYNSASNIFIIEPDAWRLSLPVNANTLALMNQRHKAMGRYQFLAEHLALAQRATAFAPTVLFPDTIDEAARDQAELTGSTSTVWIITTNCSLMCTDAELKTDSCFAVNTDICGSTPQEINLLADFLSFNRLGATYIVRKLH